MLNIGIYKIYCEANKKSYIGSTNNFTRRKNRHFSELRNNKHENEYLQRAWNKYRESDFVFEILEYCNEDVLIECEQEWIDRTDNLFNMQPAGKPPINSGEKHWMYSKGHLQVGPLNPRWGKKHTDEWKKQASLRNKGRKHTEKAKRTMAANKKNLKLTNEQVVEIKKLIKENKLSIYRIAKTYNVSWGSIGAIRDGKTHRYIGDKLC